MTHVVYHAPMASETTRGSAIRVRVEPALRVRLDKFCLLTHRNLTNAVNVLLTEALDTHDERST